MITSGCMNEIFRFFDKELKREGTANQKMREAIDAYIKYISKNRRYINLVYRETRALSAENREKSSTSNGISPPFGKKSSLLVTRLQNSQSKIPSSPRTWCTSCAIFGRCVTGPLKGARNPKSSITWSALYCAAWGNSERRVSRIKFDRPEANSGDTILISDSEVSSAEAILAAASDGQ
jgi:hypothetical protein